MPDSPRLTIGVTTCDVERYLPDALDSLLRQDFTDFEVVVCDNQSTDSTWEICQRYAAGDTRFRIFQNETNIGEAGNVNRVVGLARGEYFRLLGHDDLMEPTLLRRCVEALDANPRAVLARPQTIVIGSEGKELFACADEHSLRHRNPSRRIMDLIQGWGLCNEIFGLIRTDALRRTGLCSSNLPSSDRRILVELAVQGEFEVVEEPLFYRRVDDSTGAYSGEHGPAYQWLEPEMAKQGRFPASYAAPGGDFGRLTTETIKALLRADRTLWIRIRTATTFGVYFSWRRARTVLGRWRRQFVHIARLRHTMQSRPAD